MLDYHLSILNKHLQFFPLSILNELENNIDVYSHCSFLIITFHCEKVNEFIKSRKNLYDCKSILEYDSQKLSIKQLNFPPEIKELPKCPTA